MATAPQMQPATRGETVFVSNFSKLSVGNATNSDLARVDKVRVSRRNLRGVTEPGNVPIKHVEAGANNTSRATRLFDPEGEKRPMTSSFPVKIADQTLSVKADGATADRLLNATSEILSERATTEISLSEVARRSGLNAGLVKYYFGNKEGMLLALVRRDAGQTLNKLQKLVNMEISPVSKIRFHISGVVMAYARRPYLNRLIHHLVNDASAASATDVVDFFVAPLIRAQASILDEGNRAGVFRSVDKMHFYYAMIGACDHFFASRLSMERIFGVIEITSEQRDSYAAALISFALRYLSPDGRDLLATERSA